MSILKYLLFSLLLLTAVNAEAQQKTDSLSMRHSPSRASIMSAIVPGAGQAYNKKYWKIPVIYAGFAGLGYLVKTNNDDYKIYKDAYRLRLDGDESTTDNFVNIYSDQDLATLKNFYRRNRDLSIIGMGVLYILNIVDAAVDAHLFYFNVNDELSMQIMPGYQSGFQHNGPAVTMSLNF